MFKLVVVGTGVCCRCGVTNVQLCLREAAAGGQSLAIPVCRSCWDTVFGAPVLATTQQAQSAD